MIQGGCELAGRGHRRDISRSELVANAPPALFSMRLFLALAPTQFFAKHVKEHQLGRSNEPNVLLRSPAYH